MDKAGSSSVGFIHTRNIVKLERDIKKVQKQVRRLQPKLTKAGNKYNHILKEYEKGFQVNSLMNSVSGIETKRDHFALDFDKKLYSSSLI